jgi:hypothetical protein
MSHISHIIIFKGIRQEIPLALAGGLNWRKIKIIHYIMLYRRYYGNLRLWTRHKTYMVVEAEARNPIPLGAG